MDPKNVYPQFTHVPYRPSQSGGVLNTLPGILGLIGVILICIVFIVVMYILITVVIRGIGVRLGKKGVMTQHTLTPTQRFILAASSPTIGNNYKCVIDIWGTRESETEVGRVKSLFEWGWGEFTYENAKNMAEDCLNRGYNIRYKEYCSDDVPSRESASQYTDFERGILEELKQKYPEQGMLGWDLVRVLSIVGGAYMGGIMEYGEAAEIALKACRILQENFSSWDDMVGSYTLGYQFWRGKKKTDRLKYYKKLKKRSWIYKIPWETALKEEEL